MSRNGGGNPGWSNMLWGAVWCIGGTTVTVFSYLAAANGGGRYVMAWGAIIFGGIQFLQGLFQVLTGATTPAEAAPVVSLPPEETGHRQEQCLLALEKLGCQVNAAGPNEWEIHMPNGGKTVAYSAQQLEEITKELIRSSPPPTA